jgi:transcriptional regulator with XRE-family HTH domain
MEEVIRGDDFVMLRSVEKKKCKGCKKEFPIDDFKSRHKGHAGVITKYCVRCRDKLSAASKRWYAKNPDKKYKRTRHGTKYGVTKKNRNKPRRKRLLELRLDAGMSGNDVAKAAGIHPTFYYGLEAMTRSPISKKNGKWTDNAMRLAEYWGVAPEDLFPREARKHPQDYMPGSAELSLGAFTQIMAKRTGSDEAIGEEDLKIAMRRAMAYLSTRQKQAIELYFGFDGIEGRSLDDVSNHYYFSGITRERVRQILESAFQKLRSPVCSHILREHLEDLGSHIAVRYVQYLRALADRIEHDYVKPWTKD